MAKAIGHPIAKYASLIMSGKTLKELDFTEEPKLQHVAVKEAVLPFDKFPGDFSASQSFLPPSTFSLVVAALWGCGDTAHRSINASSEGLVGSTA